MDSRRTDQLLESLQELEELAKLGSGARFKALEKDIEKEGRKKGHKKVRDAAAIAAAVGRKRWGKARFQKMAAAGKR